MAFVGDNHVEILHQETNVDGIILRKIREHGEQVNLPFYAIFDAHVDK